MAGYRVSLGVFEWDLSKELENRRKHGVDFTTATLAFLDLRRFIAVDEAHSEQEPRYWRKGMDLYEEKVPKS